MEKSKQPALFLLLAEKRHFFFFVPSSSPDTLMGEGAMARIRSYLVRTERKYDDGLRIGRTSYP